MGGWERMALRLNLLEKKLLSKNYVFYLLFSRASFQVQENKDQRGYGYKYIVGWWLCVINLRSLQFKPVIYHNWSSYFYFELLDYWPKYLEIRSVPVLLIDDKQKLVKRVGWLWPYIKTVLISFRRRVPYKDIGISEIIIEKLKS